MFTRRLMTTALAAVAIFATAATAQAQEKFPSRTIRIIVPFAAGGGVDVLARLLAERMAPKIGVNVIIENRAGASGTVGGAHVLQSAPDGYTVLFSSNTHTMSKLVMASAPYDPLADFTPIARGGEAPLLAVLAPKLPQKTLAEVAAAAQQEPDKWTAAVPSLGSPGHVATLSFTRLTKINMTITPYRGTAPALTDVAGGHTQMLIEPWWCSCRWLKPAVSRRSRSRQPNAALLAPDIPTAAESGVPGLDVVSCMGCGARRAFQPMW